MELRMIYKNYKYILDNSNGKKFSIYEFNESNDLIKVVDMVFSFDIGFKLYNFKDLDVKEDKVIIEKENPLYQLFGNLLKNDNQLIIDDDCTIEIMARYIKFEKDKDLIIRFYDKKSNNEIDKFSVQVKNITYDLRSKIDQNGFDTKDRLRTLCADLDEVFIKNQSYQKTKTF